MVGLRRGLAVTLGAMLLAGCAAQNKSPETKAYSSVVAIGVKDGPLTLLSLDPERLEFGEAKKLSINDVNYVRMSKQDLVYGLSSTQLSIWSFEGFKTEFAHQIRTYDIVRDPTAVEVSPDGMLIYTAHWSDNILSVRHADGSDLAAPQDFECGWAHQFRPHPNGKWAYAACMKNTLMQFDVDNRTHRISPMESSDISIIGGPRHLEFHPNGQSLYVLLQITSEVAVFDLDSETGVLSDVPRQVIPTTIDGTKNKSSDLHITPDGRWLYAFNRERQEMVTFKVREDHSLSLQRIVPMGFGEVRDWAISENGDFLVTASNEGHIGVWRINQNTGDLVLASEHINAGNAISVAILQ